MNIRAVSLEGYQSHANTYLQLAPGLTVITGPSDSGKTAILRAIRWLAFGEPAGGAFINNNVGHATVSVELDCCIITKTRRGTKTSYDYTIRHGLEFENTVTFDQAAIPDEVTELLGMTKQQFGDFETALNFAYQLEAPFLISEPPSAGAKVLGTLSGTEVVDKAIKVASKDTHAARQELREADKVLGQLGAELLTYADLDDQQAALDKCRELLQLINQQQKTRVDLTALSISYERAVKRIAECTEKLEALGNVETAALYLENVINNCVPWDKLVTLQQGYDANEDARNALLDRLQLYTGVTEAGEVVERVTHTQARVAQLTRLSTSYAHYTQVAERAAEVLGSTQGVDVAAGHLAALERVQELIGDLKSVKMQHETLTRFADMVTKKLDSYNGLPEAWTLMALLPAKVEKLLQFTALQRAHKVYGARVATVADTLAYTKKMARQYDGELTQLWNTLDVCPLCENELKN